MSRPVRLFWAVLMAALISGVPNAVAAEAALQMIPTAQVADDLAAAQTQEKIRNFLSREDVSRELRKRGVSADEAERRLAGLSEAERRELAGQMDEARFGGDPFGILVVVVLVLLIIFLAKRI